MVLFYIKLLQWRTQLSSTQCSLFPYPHPPPETESIAKNSPAFRCLSHRLFTCHHTEIHTFRLDWEEQACLLSMHLSSSSLLMIHSRMYRGRPHGVSQLNHFGLEILDDWEHSRSAVSPAEPMYASHHGSTRCTVFFLPSLKCMAITS